MKWRFQWNFPILFSPHDPKTLYAGANVLMKTTDEGLHWQPISPDLTRNDKSKQGPTGGPITKDNTSVEYYDTIFTIDESPVTKGVIWAGADDGLVHVTRDGGKSWTNVTPVGIPEWIQINSIAASPHEAGAAYIAATMYKLDDHNPYLYKTSDFGKSWKKIVNGIPAGDFTRVIREDPNRRGVLVAGTETALYISSDDGENWRKFQLNVPATPITDLVFHKREDDLIVATQGRSFYVLDDMGIVRQLLAPARAGGTRLLRPEDTYRLGGGFGRGSGPAGQNPPAGAVIYYSLADKPKGDVTLEFYDAAGKLIRTISSREVPRQTPQGDADEDDGPRVPQGATRAPAEAGINRFVWDMRHADATGFPGLIMWAGNLRGPLIAPGKYEVRLAVDGQTVSQQFNVKKDPRTFTTPEDSSRQIALSLQLRDKLSQANEGVIKIREAKRQLDPYTKSDIKAVADEARELARKLSAVENELYQTKNQSNQDPLNYPIKLNNKLAALGGVVAANDTAPTSQSQMVFEELATKVNAQLSSLDRLLKDDLARFNKLVRDQNVPAVVVK